LNDISMHDEKRDLDGDPSLSIIVPAHNAANDIAACLGAIRASSIPVAYELIVVDDASTDDTRTIAARYADRVVSVESPAHGPAFVRNEGVKKSRGMIAVFVDADVVVHRDAIARMLDTFASSGVDAVFGSYDDQPSAPGIVSQYRNLLHHFVHQKSGGEVKSFWAGCGAVKKSAFEAAGGFDAERFHHAEMEDVELGYRLVDNGCTIVLDPSAQGTHRKKITLSGMITSDFIRRGVPWARVLLDRGEFLKPRGLSLGVSERVSAVSAALVVFGLLTSLVLRSAPLAIVTLLALGAFIIANAGFFRRLMELRGFAFAVAAVLLHIVYNVTAVAALIWALVTNRVSPSERERYKRRQ
jgi:glycosyltransferase involved in cell wall biosynthesis